MTRILWRPGTYFTNEFSPTIWCLIEIYVFQDITITVSFSTCHGSTAAVLCENCIDYRLLLTSSKFWWEQNWFSAKYKLNSKNVRKWLLSIHAYPFEIKRLGCCPCTIRWDWQHWCNLELDSALNNLFIWNMDEVIFLPDLDELGICFKITMPSYQDRKSHCWDKVAVGSCYRRMALALPVREHLLYIWCMPSSKMFTPKLM